MIAPAPIPSLPAIEERTSADVDLAYVALTELYGDLAIRFVGLQAYARRVSDPVKGD